VPDAELSCSWSSAECVQAAQPAAGLQLGDEDRFQNSCALSICWGTGHTDEDDDQLLFKRKLPTCKEQCWVLRLASSC